MIIDTHCHFDMMPHPEEYARRKEVEKNIVIGMTNRPSHFQMGIPHIREYKYVRLALGLHPLLAGEARNEVRLFRNLINQTSYVGEIGLDFSREGYATKEVQVEVLRELLSIVRGKKKIISVHSRRAEKELLQLLTVFDIKNVIFHWYSGPVGLISDILERGYYFSINEAMIYSRSGSTIIDNIPKERILSETDAPYNEKTDISQVLKCIGLCESDVERNFRRLISCLN